VSTDRDVSTPGVAAFDFDGTLTAGGSVFGFLSAVVGRRAAYAAAASLSPGLVHAALVGGTVADSTKGKLFERTLAGVPVRRLEEVAADFAPAHLERHLRTEVRERLDWHRRRGDQVVIVSASLDVYVRIAGTLLGADGVVATKLAAEDGLLTGHYEGANCRGEEKARRLRSWVAGSKGAGGTLWAYGNSRGDLRMLRAADVGVNVGRLGRIGRLREFPGLDGSRTDGGGA
jgi:HAD superfamily hydrolase (TIGR01490 family)